MSPFMKIPLCGSRHKDDLRLKPKAQIFVEPDAEVGLALRLVEVAVDAHFRPIFGAGSDQSRGASAELPVSRVAEPLRCEDGLDLRHVVGGRLTAVRSRCSRAGRQIAEPGAAVVPPLRPYRREPVIVRR